MNDFSKYSIVCFGEILWDILPSGALPGGAPMNVAYHLQKLGTQPALITKIGFDNYGEKLISLLSANGLSTDFFDIDYNHPTGLVYASLNDVQEVSYDIVKPSAWDFIQLTNEIISLVKQAKFFVYGSLTSRCKTSRETLYALLNEANIKVFDINLRTPHFNYNSIEYLLKSANILKINTTELELITGWFSNYENIEDRIKSIQEKFNIEIIIVTLGGEGALVKHKGKTYKHNGFKVNVADTIGSGDSFLAGFLHQLTIGSSIENALSYASGIGAFIATQHGACPPYEVATVNELINKSFMQSESL